MHRHDSGSLREPISARLAPDATLRRVVVHSDAVSRRGSRLLELVRVLRRTIWNVSFGTREWDRAIAQSFRGAAGRSDQLCDATGEPVTVVDLDGSEATAFARRAEISSKEDSSVIEKWKFVSGLSARMSRSIRLLPVRTAAMCPARWRATLCSVESSLRWRRRCD